MNRVKNSVEFIKKHIDMDLDIGIILGSGLGSLAEKIENPKIIKYEDIADFPVSTVEGHAGQFVFGELSGKNVVAMQGRFHFYEGYDISDVVLPIRSMIELGIKSLVVTNAAGGVNEDFKPGDLMIIEDHINFAGVNPLIGKNYDEVGPRFPDMSKTYTPEYIEKTKKVGEGLDLDLKSGNYIWFTGPNYETPAEVKMARALGADAAGMSTVPEVIVARHAGLKILGISCITNMAAGILDEPLKHEDVVKTSESIKKDFTSLIIETLKVI